MSKVLVTGANGYIAQYVINEFLTKGYQVIGTVRSAIKGEELEKKFQNDNFQTEVIKSLTNYEEISSVLIKHQDLKIFIHTASSSNLFTQKSEEDILIPNIESTKLILKSLKENSPNLEKFIYTSSLSSFNTSVFGPDYIDEKTWSNITYDQGKLNGFYGYAASKKYSELAIIEFFQNEEPIHFKYVIIGLSMVLGTPFFNNDPINNAAKLLLKPLQAESIEHVEPLNYITVTVEDVAKAHFQSGIDSKISNGRLLVTGNRITHQDVLEVGNTVLGLQNLIPKGEVRKEAIDLNTNVNNDYTFKLLGFKPESTFKNLQKVIQYLSDKGEFKKNINHLNTES
ncbi:NADPH-dependent methylglyoxal reductase GRE2 [Wickerhamomyces ciferrii]|uniref:NADPH-dependent methylglyoxal reductase GRE2 n=1 Tax=Wickerhamomyces ciferrii (strain ATCC 14091 / BCRC 22168 / CBS 111 / JCM 3599 / NBRC 0793 / NRRL Y-1031 F-60-10) TaxID=1206466 RepID=K0KU49_WICCF|nr:NADPH-dependent methylglyoxal reductase GRE2 [Wickerhamomyces ciferrii]CCH45552.1 NADPH-dependent methylglyoxal reductase GRE2 [Wickerhamomyces ciferrii]